MVPKEGVVVEECDLLRKEVGRGAIVKEGPIEECASRAFHYFGALPRNVGVKT
jgi:hypothetical protein